MARAIMLSAALGFAAATPLTFMWLQDAGGYAQLAAFVASLFGVRESVGYLLATD